MNKSTLDWLLNSGNPSLKYRVMSELLDLPETDIEVLEAKNMIVDSKQVIHILSKMHKDGYWLQKKSGTKLLVGDGVEYGSFATTHFCLSYLAELGLTKDNPLVAKASERYLNLQQEDGDWFQHLSCLYGYNIRTFVKLGYKNDERVQKSISLMLGNKRIDSGYLCDMQEKRSKKKKSCIHGSTKTLLAFSELPEYWEDSRCISLVNYFLYREGIFQSEDKDIFIQRDIDKSSFPITWQANLWEILYSLSKMGYGNDERLGKAWNVLERKLDIDGRIKLDWTPAQCAWKIGKRNEYNEWLTFYTMLAKKYRNTIK